MAEKEKGVEGRQEYQVQILLEDY